MVALKRSQESPQAEWRILKQERRGGIETPEGVEESLDKGGEAGTPWWH